MCGVCVYGVCVCVWCVCMVCVFSVYGVCVYGVWCVWCVCMGCVCMVCVWCMCVRACACVCVQGAGWRLLLASTVFGRRNRSSCKRATQVRYNKLVTTLWPSLQMLDSVGANGWGSVVRLAARGTDILIVSGLTVGDPWCG